MENGAVFSPAALAAQHHVLMPSSSQAPPRTADALKFSTTTVANPEEEEERSSNDSSSYFSSRPSSPIDCTCPPDPTDHRVFDSQLQPKQLCSNSRNPQITPSNTSSTMRPPLANMGNFQDYRSSHEPHTKGSMRKTVGGLRNEKQEIGDAQGITLATSVEPSSNIPEPPQNPSSIVSGPSLFALHSLAPNTECTSSSSTSIFTSSNGFRVMIVGGRVRSHNHFDAWLESEEPIRKLRSPGKHYSSHSHSSHLRRTEGSSEGNRFIIDDQL